MQDDETTLSKLGAGSANQRIDEVLLEKASKTDLRKLSIERLLELRAALRPYYIEAPKKQECACEIVSVDDDPNRPAGWQCRCFKLTNPNRKIASHRGPGFTNWVGGSSGGVSPAGNITETVVDPISGEAFVIEYKCRCKDEAF